MKNRITKEDQKNYLSRIINDKENLLGVITGPSAEMLSERTQIEIDVLNEIYCTVSQSNMADYQISALRTTGKLTPEEMVLNGVLGLNGESGEIADLYKKYKFQGHDLDEDKFIEELGDVLWYVALVASGIGVNLSEVAQRNAAKLQRRYPQGFDPEKSKHRV